MSLPFVLPPLTSDGPLPEWAGNHFKIGETLAAVLEYSSNSFGWNDDLTFFHEETAGDQHFIDKASRDHATGQLKENLVTPYPTILEIGCSSGFMLERLHKTFPKAIIMGADVVSAPLVNLAKRMPGTPLFRFDLTQCPLPDNSIDAVVILNVLEHIENDILALEQIHRILKPGGIAVIEVPAGPHLYDFYDKLLMHFRRYNLKELAQLVKQTGFKVTKKSHLGCFLYPGFQFIKKRNQKITNSHTEQQKELVNQSISNTGSNFLLHMIMQTELLLGHAISYPFGIRCLITCKKL